MADVSRLGACCPTCGRLDEDERVHSTPAPIHPPPPVMDQWRLDLAELIRLVRGVLAEENKRSDRQKVERWRSTMHRKAA